MKIHLYILCALLLLSHRQAAADNADIVNERPHLSAAELARHWRLDCKKTAKKLLETYSGSDNNKTATPPLPSQEITEIGYCAHIYNVPDSGRFQPCPNYRGAADFFAMPTNITAATPKEIAEKLGHFFNECPQESHDQ
jgi:hypothetical protein